MQDGKVKCKRKKCLKTRCNGKTSSTSQTENRDDCCPTCPEDGLATTSTSPLISLPSKDNDRDSNKKKKQREGRRLQRRQEA